MPKAQSGTIVVVDDDAAVLSSLRFLLETEGFAVRLFDSGKALLAASGIENASCVLLDYRMPGIDGIELAKALRARHIVAPIILITGRAEIGLDAQAAAAGIDRIIEKPLLDSTLLDAVAAAPQGSA
jgi:two-component system, LuxR family, response regulator FixJ